MLEPYLKKYKNTINLTDTSSRDIAQYFQDGFWTSNKYLPGMYLRIENYPDKPGVNGLILEELLQQVNCFCPIKR